MLSPCSLVRCGVHRWPSPLKGFGATGGEIGHGGADVESMLIWVGVMGGEIGHGGADVESMLIWYVTTDLGL